MNALVLLLLAAFAALSILMVLTMVPYSLELIQPSADMSENRRRLRRMGAVGTATAWCVPGWRDHVLPRRLWGALYFTTWLLIVAMGVVYMLLATPPGRSVARNLIIVLGVAGGWFGLHAGIIAFARALQRANERDAQHRANATEKDDEDETDLAADTVAVADAPREPSRGGSVLGTIAMLVAVIALRVVADYLPFLNTTHAFIARHATPVRATVIAMLAIGVVTFMAALFMLILGGGDSGGDVGDGDGGGSARAMSHEEVGALYAQNMRSMQSSTAVARAAGYRIRGETYGRTGHDEWTFAAMKAAWRRGDWRTDSVWRRRYLVMCGALLMTVGVFSMPAVFGPPWVILLCGLVLLYAFVRTTWAFYRA